MTKNALQVNVILRYFNIEHLGKAAGSTPQRAIK
jgi:hypothetical protein